MNENNVRRRNPSELLAIDETLYPYRGTIGFKQYNPSKPASLCDYVTTYTYSSLPYAGKPGVTEGAASMYYVTRTDEYTKYLINEI